MKSILKEFAAKLDNTKQFQGAIVMDSVDKDFDYMVSVVDIKNSFGHTIFVNREAVKIVTIKFQGSKAVNESLHIVDVDNLQVLMDVFNINNKIALAKLISKN